MTYKERISNFEQFKADFAVVYRQCQASQSRAIADGPMDEQACALVRLGIAIGLQHAGAIQSNVRKCLSNGHKPDVIRQIVKLGVGTLGLPALSDIHTLVEETLG